MEFGHPSEQFSRQLLNSLTEEINVLSGNKEVSVIILRSKGQVLLCRRFFDELLAVSNQGRDNFSPFANLINAMRKCSKIIVGRIHGKQWGGVGIAAACDYAFATVDSSIKLSNWPEPFVIEPP
jgi:methylglutaconyl-CoA hydratase